jgi:hypothetical protein
MDQFFGLLIDERKTSSRFWGGSEKEWNIYNGHFGSCLRHFSDAVVSAFEIKQKQMKTNENK